MFSELSPEAKKAAITRLRVAARKRELKKTEAERLKKEKADEKARKQAWKLEDGTKKDLK